jgi:hypothetical protein
MSNIKSSNTLKFTQNVYIPAPQTLAIGTDAPEAQLHVEHHNQIAGAILGEGYTSGDSGLTGVTILNGGSGYTDGNYGISVNGHPGNGSISLGVSGGVIVSATVSSSGAGFISSSTLTTAAADLSPLGGGTGAQLALTANFAGHAFGVKGVAAVGFSSAVETLTSVIAGSPENTQGDVIYNAVGLQVEDVTIGIKNWAIRTGVGTVEFNDTVKNLPTSDAQILPFTFHGNIVVGTSGPGGPIDLCVVGDYLYTANVSDSSVSVIDISIPTNPIQVANVAITGANSPQAFYVYAQGRYLYVASLGEGTGQLTAFDISIPVMPLQVGTVALSSGANDVKVVGHYAYVVTFAALLHIIDISDPANMQIVGTTGPGSGPISFNGVDISGNVAYVASQNAGGGGLFSYNISDPTNPTDFAAPIGVGEGGHPWQIAISGHYAYITLNATSSMAIVDISGVSPQLVSTLTSLGTSPNGIVVVGRYAYVACSNSTLNELDIIDISIPTAPIKVKSLAADLGCMSLVINGPFVYASNYTQGTVSTYYTLGMDTTSVTAASAKVGNLRVSDQAEIRGELQVGRSLSVKSGIVSQGDVLVRGDLLVQGQFSPTSLRTSSVNVEALNDSVPVTIRNHNNQSSNLIEFKDNGGNAAAVVTANGALIAKYLSGQTVVVSPSPTPTIDLSLGNVFYMHIDADTTPTFTGGSTGQQITLIVQQDATGHHTWTWPVSTNNKLPVNPTPNTYTMFDLVRDGGNIIVSSSSIVRATNGVPQVDVAATRATGSIGSGNNLLQIEAAFDGTGGNGIIVNFDTSQAWGSTTAYIFVGHVLVVNLKNDGVLILDTAATVASVINSTSQVNSIITVTNSPGSDPAFVNGINTATQVILGGAIDATIGTAAAGGELRFTSDHLYVGQTDNTWKAIQLGVPTVQLASDPGSLDIDLSLGPIVKITMNGSIPITVHNAEAGQRYTFVVQQGGGSDILAWNTSVFKGATSIGGTGTSVQEFICINESGTMTLYATSPGVNIS